MMKITRTDAIYFCEPPGSGINTIINDLLPKVRGKAQASSNLQLPYVRGSGLDRVDAHVVLVMWISTPLDDSADVGSDQGLIFGSNNLNCKKDGTELIIS